MGQSPELIFMIDNWISRRRVRKRDCQFVRAFKSKRHNIAPMAMGGIARLAFACAEEKGADLDSLLRNSQLSCKQISDPRARFEVRKQIKLLELVAETVGDDLIG